MMENKNTCLNDESEIASMPNYLAKGDKNITPYEGGKSPAIPDSAVITEENDLGFIVGTIPKKWKTLILERIP